MRKRPLAYYAAIGIIINPVSLYRINKEG